MCCSSTSRKSIRAQRDEIVIRSCGYEVGKDQERGRGRRLLDRLQQQRRALRAEQMELVEDHHLAVALDRGERCGADDLAGLVERDRRADPGDLLDVGVLAAEHQFGVAFGRIVDCRPAATPRTPCAASFLVDPAGPTNR